MPLLAYSVLYLVIELSRYNCWSNETTIARFPLLLVSNVTNRTSFPSSSYMVLSILPQCTKCVPDYCRFTSAVAQYFLCYFLTVSFPKKTFIIQFLLHPIASINTSNWQFNLNKVYLFGGFVLKLLPKPLKQYNCLIFRFYPSRGDFGGGATYPNGTIQSHKTLTTSFTSV